MNAQLLAGLPMPQRLALSYAPARSRGVNLAFLALDARLGAIVRAGREPIAAQLRLAWWRETLAKPSRDWPRGEPLLEALREWADPTCLSGLPNAWEMLLLDTLTPGTIAAFVGGRAHGFVCLARELEVSMSEEAAAAGRIWAAADLAAHLADGDERRLVVAHGRALGKPGRLPSSLRPLTVLASLAAAALARGGGALLGRPGATLLALRTGLTGR